ncbi:MAG: hypothetical protein IPK32_01340 [Verrucomicrobiaceae bacterium]|nr:hypothetical protein [Verrucomicrobiaceae bacterium]
MPATPLYAHEYLLRSGGAINAASQRREFAGALIRSGDGYGCIHPWPEFGDSPLSEQLSLLASGITTPITDMALHCAEIDGAARRAGLSLFHGLHIPRSHYSWSFAAETEPQLHTVITQQWPAIKAKGHIDHAETAHFLNQAAQHLAPHGIRLRVDFNGVLTATQFDQFLTSLSPQVLDALDFIEDPFPYDADAWEAVQQRHRIHLALDKNWINGTHGFHTVVIKPARRDWRSVAQLHPQKRLLMTSAMDHAFGQMFAAYQSALAAVTGHDLHHTGLCTQHLFAPDAFFERLHSPGGQLQPDTTGGGLGFGDLLEKLPWKRIR